MGGFNFIFCVAENFIKTVGFDFIVSNANNFVKIAKVDSIHKKHKNIFSVPHSQSGKSLIEIYRFYLLYILDFTSALYCSALFRINGTAAR